MKKTLKFLLASVVALTLVFGIMQPVSLATVSANDVITKTESGGKVGNTEDLTNFGGTIVDILTTIAIVVSIVVLIVIGIKYIIGGAQEKAKYKETLIPVTVGVIIIIFASTIVKFLFSIKGGN